ncbi:uncharacterized protein BDW43DRAFT_317016 [Aspergillus alliaceus]|uniref:uncharacterized protein n=1 Tax=Petromyces alliaceus TaxID=209559 RepID=UPI0012A509BB|nr:uncharacterized protein BDW43DRAFT_317016 [Aspergillus alliaceus]KAB8227221.1 hypothetical protein BDW43DRAFT_317016 [Aspergillus alliaceus]
MTNTNRDRCCIAVAGDSPIQNLKYPPPSPNEGARKETYIHGGAQQLAKYLQAIHSGNVYAPQPDEGSTSNNEVAYFVELVGVDPNSKTPSFRAKSISPSPHSSCLQLPQTWGNIQDKLKVVIFEDSASEFSNDQGVAKITDSTPQLLIYKMTGRAGYLARVSQWTRVRNSHFKPGEEDAGRVIVIVDAEDLRAEGIELSRHLS